MENVDQNWYSSEAQKHEREKALEALKKMKELESLFYKTRKKIIEKTSCGIRTSYVKC